MTPTPSPAIESPVDRGSADSESLPLAVPVQAVRLGVRVVGDSESESDRDSDAADRDSGSDSAESPAD